MISMTFHPRRVVEGGAVREESGQYALGGVEARLVRLRRESAQEGHARVDLRHKNHRELQQEIAMHRPRETEEDSWCRLRELNPDEREHKKEDHKREDGLS